MPQWKYSSKLMLKDHPTYFNENRKTGFGMHDEQGENSIDNEFNQLKIAYCWLQPASRPLERMLQKHYTSIHPESKVVNSKINFPEKEKQPCSITRN